MAMFEYLIMKSRPRVFRSLAYRSFSNSMPGLNLTLKCGNEQLEAHRN